METVGFPVGSQVTEGTEIGEGTKGEERVITGSNKR